MQRPTIQDENRITRAFLRNTDEIRSNILREIFVPDASVFENRTASVVLSAARIGSATFVSLDHAADGTKIDGEIGSYSGSVP